MVYVLASAAAVVAVKVGASRGGVVALWVIFLFYWSVFAIINWGRRITIDDQQIEMRGYFGGPLVIRKSDVASCRYRRLQANVRGSPDVFFFAVRDHAFREVEVWRYGWGRNRRRLFECLEEWLEESPCEIDDLTLEKLKRASNSA